VHTEKSLATLFNETKTELKDFIQTRLQILMAELKEKGDIWKVSLPLLGGALAVLLAGWMTLTFALVALVRAWFLPSPYGWVWGGLIVAGVYFIAGLSVGWFAYGEIKSAGIAPTRTLTVLKQDQVWIQNEARTA